MNFYHRDDIPDDLLPFFREAPEIGVEKTPAEYVARLVDVFREVRRVLRDDGTLWLNLGDSYAGAGYSNHAINGEMWKDSMNGDKRHNRQQVLKKALEGEGIKPKDLIGIPWRVAFALQLDGWYLRQDIIWHKPNPMPESVRDRCTKAHEYIFLLSKKPKYYFDSESMKEPAVSPGKRIVTVDEKTLPGGKHGKAGARASGVVRLGGGETRTKRSVWTIATKPYKDAHFATFPPDLIEPCILAGCPIGGAVLDPFTGSGTTGMVALRHRRQFIGIELNPAYVEMIHRRIADHQSLEKVRLK